VRLRKPPAIVQQILLPPLATHARWLGKERTIERYLDLGMHPSALARLGRLPERIMPHQVTTYTSEGENR
jgi:hypothetical protein